VKAKTKMFRARIAVPFLQTVFISLSYDASDG
jgi:hypothetical protein